MPSRSQVRRSRFVKVFGTDLPEVLVAVQEYDIDIRNFAIYLGGISRNYDNSDDVLEPGVEYQMATRFIKNIRTLSTLDPVRPILVHMKTCGGIFEEGMAIYDAIKLAPNKIVILNYTHARSMSSIILQAADKRVMMPNSYFMVHEGTFSIDPGTHKYFISNAEWNKRSAETMLKIYVEKMKEKGRFRRWSKDKIRDYLQELMDRKQDVFLPAERTVEWGLADSIFDGNWENLRKRFPRVTPRD